MILDPWYSMKPDSIHHMASKTFTTEEIMQKVSTGKPYTLLILLSGSPVPDDDNLVNQMQLEHLAHLFRLEHEGKASIYGPISNDEQLHGIIIFNTTDKEEIEKLMADDPYIQAGYLNYQLYDWFSIPGQQLP
jgi:uncharacterized protein YciI